MQWIRERAWQMGIGVLIILIGAVLVYQNAAFDPVNRGMMWVGLALMFIGFLIPLLTRLFERIQETSGEEGET